MRVGIIGLGSAGTRHATNLLELGCEVLGYDVRPDLCLQGAPVCIRPEAIWDWPPDAVVIATPADTHEDWLCEAIDLGLAVYVEKPIATRLTPKLREAVAVSEASGIVTQVGYQLRFQSQVQDIRRRLRSADTLRLSVSADMRTWPGRGYSSALLECSHELDLALWLAGAARVTEVRGADPKWLICLRHDAGALSGIEINGGAASYYRRWQVFGAGGGFDRVYRDPSELGDSMYRDALAHFLTCVRDRQPTICPLGDGLAVLELCEAIQAKAAEPIA